MVGKVALFALMCMATVGCSFLLTGDYSDSSQSDAGAPSSSSSSSRGPDATPDAPADQDRDASGPFCAAHADAQFCDDFDDPDKPLAVLWDGTSVNGGALDPKIDDAISRSPTSALLAQTPALVSGKSAASGIKRKVAKPATPTSTVRVELAMYFEQLDVTADVFTARLAFGAEPTDAKSKIFLRVQDGVAYVSQEGPKDDAGAYKSEKTKSLVLLSEGHWYNVVLTVQFATRKISLSIDGQVTEAAMIAETMLGDVQLMAGIAYAYGPTSAMKIRYDDVVIDVQ